MAKSFDYSEEIAYPLDRVHATVTDPAFWQHRFEEAPEKLTLDDSRGPGTLTATMRDTIGASSLPGLVRKVVSGELKVERADEWCALDGDHADGRVSGSSTGIPVKIESTAVLRAAGDVTVLRLAGSVQVKIPLVGGQIESLVRKLVGDMVGQDRDAIEKWLGDH
ncbi:hypothetical protein OPAG_04309 [Rhodococcus opacus PD630]|uniref:DUF2505 domain-containing protein n=1 Tax=Rhodococcus opacus TaxID=37919 RepID=UPI00029CBD79|nr:DUF2505 domain-containing protein [Rhodococcus opacus]AHK29479.1 Uncharacterized protein Pd630_LPD02254 [Rhodococcus opacus PD630]EHI45818.1 hypothetical protein OPAG_04309 [Rhodococcus opacus PD630]UDG99246.1 DUF2505 domain-containing protein [Rhodococcus opacus PD630]